MDALPGSRPNGRELHDVRAEFKSLQDGRCQVHGDEMLILTCEAGSILSHLGQPWVLSLLPIKWSWLPIKIASWPMNMTGCLLNSIESSVAIFYPIGLVLSVLFPSSARGLLSNISGTAPISTQVNSKPLPLTSALYRLSNRSPVCTVKKTLWPS